MFHAVCQQLLQAWQQQLEAGAMFWQHLARSQEQALTCLNWWSPGLGAAYPAPEQLPPWQQGLTQSLALWASMAEQYSTVLATGLGMASQLHMADRLEAPGELSARLAALEERLDRLAEHLEAAVSRSVTGQLEALAERLDVPRGEDLRARLDALTARLEALAALLPPPPRTPPANPRRRKA